MQYKYKCSISTHSRAQ